MTERETKSGTIRELTREEDRALLDRVARRNLTMSGEEFMRRCEAGEFANSDAPEVMRVVMLLSFVS